MTALSIQAPFPAFADRDGQPLENGYIHIGVVNLNPIVNPVAVFFDAALTIPAVQPIRTLDGYPVYQGTPAVIYVNSNYSILVQDKKGTTVYSAPAATARYSEVVVSSVNAEDVIYDPPFTNAVQTNVEAKLAQTISVKDFGAVGDGITNDGPAIQLAINAASAAKAQLNFLGKTYLIETAIELKSNVSLVGMPGTVLFVSPSCILGPSFGGNPRAIYINVDSENVFIENIIFQSTSVGLTQHVSVAFQKVTNLYINNCQFIDFGDSTYTVQGLIVFDSSDVTISNSTFSNNTSDGCSISNEVINFEFSNNICTDNGDWGFAAVEGCKYGNVVNNAFLNNYSTAAGTDRCSYISFVNNQIENNEHGIRISEFASTVDKNQFIAISNNNIVNSLVASISIENMNSAFGQFSVTTNNIAGSSNQGIRIINSELGTIVGNTIYSCGAEGILFNADTAAVATGLCTVVGNSIVGVTYGIRQITGAGFSGLIIATSNLISGASVANTLFVNAQFLEFNNASFASIGQPLNFPSAISSGSANTGGITPPGNVQGFLPLYLSGILYKIPYYNA